MITARSLRNASNSVLRAHILNGHPVDPAAIEGWVYRGTSLGLPEIFVRLTWRTFQKTFFRDPATDRLLGWNVRLEQDGIDAPSRPKMRDGRPVTEWNYEVIAPDGVPMPRGFDRGLVIDYGRAPNPPGPVHVVKDPLVALEAGNSDHLLGVSYLVLGGRFIETPTYFSLEREHRIEYVPDDVLGTPGVDPLRLSNLEREWAEALFAAILGTGGAEGLPPLSAIDRTTFWRTFERAPAPLVRAGLRPMVSLLTFLPLLSYGRPFFRLSHDERAQFLARAADDRRYAVRQAFVTLKTLACFAYFDDDGVRRHFEPGVGA